MYCVIQQVMRKKLDVLGEHKEIIPYPLEMSINGVAQVPIWRWDWSKERYERPHREAYKISLQPEISEALKKLSADFAGPKKGGAFAKPDISDALKKGRGPLPGSCFLSEPVVFWR